MPVFIEHAIGQFEGVFAISKQHFPMHGTHTKTRAALCPPRACAVPQFRAVVTARNCGTAHARGGFGLPFAIAACHPSYLCSRALVGAVAARWVLWKMLPLCAVCIYE